MPLQPHHVGINVTDLDRSTAFYAALGFTEIRRFPAEEGLVIAFMSLGGLLLELFQYADVVPRPGAHADHVLGLRHLALGSDDIERDVEALKQAGIIPTDTAIRTLANGTKLVFFPDPDGVEVEIMHHE